MTSWAAKTKAERAPSVPAGTRSGSRLSARSAQPRVEAEATHVPAATPALRKPSGTCISGLSPESRPARSAGRPGRGPRKAARLGTGRGTRGSGGTGPVAGPWDRLSSGLCGTDQIPRVPAGLGHARGLGTRVPGMAYDRGHGGRPGLDRPFLGGAREHRLPLADLHGLRRQHELRRGAGGGRDRHPRRRDRHPPARPAPEAGGRPRGRHPLQPHPLGPRQRLPVLRARVRPRSRVPGLRRPPRRGGRASARRSPATCTSRCSRCRSTSCGPGSRSRTSRPARRSTSGRACARARRPSTTRTAPPPTGSSTRGAPSAT